MVMVHGAYTASNLLAGTFLSIFLWRASHDLTPIAVYSGLSAVMIPVAFLANGLVWRRLGAGASIRLLPSSWRKPPRSWDSGPPSRWRRQSAAGMCRSGR